MEPSQNNETYTKHHELNKHVAKGIAKHIGNHQWEMDLKDKLINPGIIASDSLIVPLMKQCAAKYHDEAVKQKKKAEAAVREANQKIYRATADGQWAMCKRL